MSARAQFRRTAARVEIGLSLGSNMGSRLANLREAALRIGRIPGVSVSGCSPVYETEPVGVPERLRTMRFLNAVLIMRSALDARKLMENFRRIERAMGRLPVPTRNTPRPIDIDIIYAGRARISAPGLRIPHPRACERRFVLQPLADLRPDLRLPCRRRTVAQLLAALPAGQPVKLVRRRI